MQNVSYCRLWNRKQLVFANRPVCTSVQSDQTLTLLADQITSSHLDNPKNDNEQFQNKWKMDYSFKEIQQMLC